MLVVIVNAKRNNDIRLELLHCLVDSILIRRTVIQHRTPVIISVLFMSVLIIHTHLSTFIKFVCFCMLLFVMDLLPPYPANLDSYHQIPGCVYSLHTVYT